MPMKIRKRSSENEISVERIHHAKTYKLAVDRSLCVGCELCNLICPREAITVAKKDSHNGDKAHRPTIDIDEDKCQFCGICASICPFGAAEVTLNGEKTAFVIDKESFPELIREIVVDESKCPVDCTECELVCPLNLIKVKSDSTKGKVTVSVNKENCPCCRVCDLKCPESAFHIRRIFTGRLKIHKELCPQGCQDCLDVCPIQGALYLSEEDGKVHVYEPFCVYCGVCRIVCPEQGALELSRSTIHHTPVKSGAWNKALEKLTSTVDMAKELRGKGKKRTMDAVKKRFEKRKEPNE